MHLVEHVGSGIGRIQVLMKFAGLPEPAFQKEGIFTVILKRPENSSEKSSEKIIELLETHSETTIAELTKKLSMSTRAVEKQPAKLNNQEKIERVGPSKGGYWKIVKQKTIRIFGIFSSQPK